MLAQQKSTVGGDPYGAMLRGGLRPGAVVAAVSVVVFIVLDGALGLAGGLLAAAVVLVSSASSVVLLRRTVGLDPRVMFLAAMVGYLTKVMLLGVLLLLFRNASWLSPMAFAVTAIVTSLAWTTGELIAYSRVRTLIYDEPAASPGGPR